MLNTTLRLRFPLATHSLALTTVILSICWAVYPQRPAPGQSAKTSQNLKAELGRIIVKPGGGPALALPDFTAASQPASAQAREFSHIIFADLQFAGVVNMIGKSLYPRAQIDDPLHIDFVPWGKDPVRADYLLVGSLLTTADQLRVEVYLYDVQAGNRLLVKTYQAEAQRQRRLAHRIADDIVQFLTGTPGIASSRIAFVSRRSGRREIYLMDYDGFNVQRFTFDRSIALFPSWSPDGKRIAYLSFLGGRPHIEIRSVSDRRHVGGLRFNRGTASSPVFAPDGTHLAFSSSKDSNSMQLYVADLQTGRLRRLTRSRTVVHTSPRWNPRTGRQIAFISNQSGTPQIYLIDIDGSNLHRVLTQGGLADSPAWSPNGQYLAFAWRPPEASSYDIFVMDIASQQIVQLTHGSGSNESPTWSPDGRHLAFQSNRTGRFEIYLMQIDGSGVKQVTTSGGTSPAWWGERRSTSSNTKTN